MDAHTGENIAVVAHSVAIKNNLQMRDSRLACGAGCTVGLDFVRIRDLVETFFWSIKAGQISINTIPEILNYESATIQFRKCFFECFSELEYFR